MGADHMVNAIVISVDGSPAAGVRVTFTVTAGPDINITSAEMTDPSGQARFAFTNTNTPGTDIIEAASLGGKGTAMVTFT